MPLSIVAYNVHLLPNIALGVAGKRSEPEYRARVIGEQLAQHGIIGISEAFDKKYSKTLLESLQKNSPNSYDVAKGPGRSGRHFIGGGLLLSHWPIEQSHTITYSHASRFVGHGLKADGFAAKGALHARLQVGEDEGAVIDCFLTHLES